MRTLYGVCSLNLGCYMPAFHGGYGSSEARGPSDFFFLDIEVREPPRTIFLVLGKRAFQSPTTGPKSLPLRLRKKRNKRKREKSPSAKALRKKRNKRKKSFPNYLLLRILIFAAATSSSFAFFRIWHPLAVTASEIYSSPTVAALSGRRTSLPI